MQGFGFFPMDVFSTARFCDTVVGGLGGKLRPKTTCIMTLLKTLESNLINGSLATMIVLSAAAIYPKLPPAIHLRYYLPVDQKFLISIFPCPRIFLRGVLDRSCLISFSLCRMGPCHITLHVILGHSV